MRLAAARVACQKRSKHNVASMCVMKHDQAWCIAAMPLELILPLTRANLNSPLLMAVVMLASCFLDSGGLRQVSTYWMWLLIAHTYIFNTEV